MGGMSKVKKKKKKRGVRGPDASNDGKPLPPLELQR